MDKFERVYRKVLALALDNRGFVVMIAVSLLVLSGFIAFRLGI